MVVLTNYVDGFNNSDSLSYINMHFMIYMVIIMCMSRAFEFIMVLKGWRIFSISYSVTFANIYEPRVGDTRSIDEIKSLCVRRVSRVSASFN